jgi:hypothetical protein
MVCLVYMKQLLLVVQIIFFDLESQGAPFMVFTFVLADLLISIIIILLHKIYGADISNLRHYNQRLG